MNRRGRRSFRWLVALPVVVMGCGRAERVAPVGSEGDAAPPAASSACLAGVAQKLDVTFLHVCDGRSGRPRPSFWMSVTPIGCAAGEHDTLRCPPVVPLAKVGSDGRSLVPTAARLAAVVEAETAHQVCTMRFAGRLPTRDERVRAREELGLATMVVSESSEHGGYRFDELAEWVTQQACERPTLLSAECGAARFPWGASPSVPWHGVVSCDQRATDSLEGRALADVNGTCAMLPAAETADGQASGGGRRDVPCVVRGAGVRPEQGALGILLRCARPTAAPRHADVVADVAAFRCVIPEWL